MNPIQSKHILLSLFLSSCLTLLADSTKPYIVLFLVDDMGPMESSYPLLADAEGTPVRHPLNDQYRTPNMERLATQGIVFSEFYAHTVCSPSRSSIMTGQNSARHRTTNFIGGNNQGNGPKGWNWEGLKEGTITLPMLLSEAGYQTIHIGKGHFAPINHFGADPRDIGFDVNIGGNHSGAPRSFLGQTNDGELIKHPGWATPVPDLEEYHGSDVFLTEALTRKAMKEVDQSIEAEKPFFLYMSLYTLLSGKKDHQRQNRFLHHFPHGRHGNRPWTFLRSGDWKLLYQYYGQAGKPKVSLYNLKEDISESNDLAKQYPETVQKLLQSMAQQLDEMGALYNNGAVTPQQYLKQ